MFAPRSPTFFPFELAADELRKEEFVRLADAVPPTLEALRSLTPAPLRAEVALMLERLGYLVHSDASAHDLVVTKDGRKYIVACAPPADREPTPTRDLARLHAAVVVATAEGGFYVTTRSFTPSAEAYAAGAPIKLVDGEMLIASLKRSKAGAAMPDTYRAMCRQCGDIVQHRLDRPEAQPCVKGHPVVSTIARAAIYPERRERLLDEDAPQPVVKRRRNMSAKARRLRRMRAHNYRALAVRRPNERG